MEPRAPHATSEALQKRNLVFVQRRKGSLGLSISDRLPTCKLGISKVGVESIRRAEFSWVTLSLLSQSTIFPFSLLSLSIYP